MASPEPFTFITEDEGLEPEFFGPYLDRTGAKVADLQTHLLTDLREQYPELIISIIPAGNVNLLAFAAAGHAQAELDLDDEPIVRWRGYSPPSTRHGTGGLAESRFFAKYRYTWNSEDFILYSVVVGLQTLQYVLKEPHGNETTLSNSAIVDRLILAIGEWYTVDEDIIYVYDGYWSASKTLWEQVQDASWDKVILDPKMKKDLVEVSDKFFDSKDVYDEYGVPWKRGLIFHGPVGNGKTISIKALMHTLTQREQKIPSLYVKNASQTFNIRGVFQFARSMSPCLLVLEDIETIVTPNTRSYFFNEVDGLENNDGILMVATTNYQSLCLPIAQLLDDFSFAYMQEAFVATLLILARGSEPKGNASASDNPEQYKFYRIMKEEADMLREDMDKSDASASFPILQGEGQSGRPGDHSSERVDKDLQVRHVGSADTSAVRTLRRYFSVRQ
ncbi:hypothetical protein LQW54_005708 [Pestalotiopsis sp. IQ-011]